ncbi:MAG: disulfide bond formation protein DsbB [Glaciecola sp.]|jgi:disulfide bond formation protein DsbB
MFYDIQQWSHSRAAWQVLFLSAISLLAAALYFQHVQGLQPCIMCIYQRTAVIGILIAGFIPLAHNSFFTRLIGFAVWGTASVQGFLVSTEHKDILFGENSFLVPCIIEPNFPSSMPLHQWFPNLFGAPGDCYENTWQFFSLGMAEWMQVIFAIYTAVFAFMFILQFISFSNNKTIRQKKI